MCTKQSFPLLFVMPDKQQETITATGGDTYMGNYVPATGHDNIIITQTATMITYQCTVCGMISYEYIQIDPPTEYGLRNGNVSVVTEHHEYIYASGKLLREVITTTDEDGNTSTQTLDFTYDASGHPYTLTYTNGTASPVTYYYVVNLQGDVMRLVSASGATVAEYWYEPYGEVQMASGAMAEVNPLRYRGYYYDAEAEFYYLQSRYYDPAICRFVNADGLLSTGRGFLGYNMFAYCNNNPACMSDPSGYAIGRSHIVMVCDGGSARFYDDIDDAALAAAIEARRATDADNNEHGRVIYESPNGKYYLGKDITGTHSGLDYSSVPGIVNEKLPENVVAAVHSHPNCNGHQGNVFSGDDAYFVEGQQIYLYLAAPNGTLYVLTPEETAGCHSETNPWIIDESPTAIISDNRLISKVSYNCREVVSY